jgi:alpha-D-xyloside xylohydrolase
VHPLILLRPATLASLLLTVVLTFQATPSTHAQTSAYTQTSTSVFIPINGTTIELCPLEPGVIRVLIHTLGAPADPATVGEVVFTPTLPTPKFNVTQSPETITVTTDGLTAVVNRSTGTIIFTDAQGKILLQESPEARTLPIAAPENPTVQESFLTQPDEHLYGSGQFQDGFLNIRDLPRRLTQVNSQISIPFLLSSKGYGILWHNYGRTDLNPADQLISLTKTGTGKYTISQSLSGDSSLPDERQTAFFTGTFNIPTAGTQAMFFDSGWAMERRYNIEIDGHPLFDFANYWLPPTTSWFSTLAAGSHTIKVAGDIDDAPKVYFRPANNLTTLRSFTGHTIDYTVFAGPTSDDVIRRYRDVTGNAPLMPKWLYGYTQSRARYYTQSELLENLTTFREHKLPLDLIVQDWMYWGKYGWNAMKFDETLYPDPAGMVKSVHDQHAHIMISVWSRIAPETELGKQLTDQKLYIPGTEWIDFFNPKAREFYWHNFATRMVPYGFDAWWLDATEPENDDLHTHTVTTGSGEAVRLLYPLMVNRTVYEGMRQAAPNRRFFILTRNAFLGQQRYASAVWSGDIGNDFATLRREITAGLGYSASGMPYWTTDTGGFFRPGKSQFTDPAYHERLLRWVEFSTFTPLMRLHGWLTPTEPWLYGPQVESTIRKYFDLRSQLVPYNYSQAAEVTFHGSSLLRPLVMDFANDPTALDQKYEFMSGKSLLVAPVTTAGIETASVYLPINPAGWFDFWTENHSSGAQTIQTPAKLDTIPVFVRAGSILPLGPVQQYVTEKPDSPVELRVYPGADANFTLYDDEGTTYDYEHGQFATIPLHWNNATSELEIGKRTGSYPGMPTARTFTLHLAGSTTPAQTVHYTGSPIHATLK